MSDDDDAEDDGEDDEGDTIRTLIGSLSNDNGDGNENVTNLHI